MRLWLGLLVGGALLAQPAAAQQDLQGQPSRGYAQREDLLALADFYDRSAESPAYSDALRERASAQASELRRRLEDGDFQVGDRVLLFVQGEPTLSDTFAVAPGQVLDLPELGAISVRGVLRADLEQHLAAQLGRFLLEPRIVARSLVRISIAGAVARPGFYTVPSETVLSDILMVAGGPAPEARLDALSVERGGRTHWSGRVLQDAIVAGETLDQLGLIAGDRIVVPARGGGLGAAEGPVRTVGLLLAIPLSIYTLTQLF